MSKEPAPLEEVSVVARLDEKGITVAAKSRFLSALDALVGDLVAWAGAGARARRQTAQARADVEEDLLRADGKLAVQLLKEEAGGGRRTLENFLRAEARVQSNKDAVAEVAFEELRTLPAPSEATSSSTVDEQTVLAEDWLNIFADHAGRASSEEMRRLWGRILAGEVDRPGSFSPRTLRIVAELDQELARLFERIVQRRFLDDSTVPCPSGLKGDELFDYALLEESGLLHSVSSKLGIDINGGVAKEGYVAPEGGKVGSLLLRVHFHSHGQSTRLSMVKISHVGQQIARIMPAPSDIEVYRYAAQCLDLSNVVSVEICRFVEFNSTKSFRFNVVETLDVDELRRLQS